MFAFLVAVMRGKPRLNYATADKTGIFINKSLVKTGELRALSGVD